MSVHNWNSLTSAVAMSLVVAALWVIGSRAKHAKHESWGNDEIYHYPPGYGYLMLGGAVFISILPLLFPRDATQLTVVTMWLVAGAGLAAAVYFFRYRVTVGISTLEFGAWNPVSIPLSDIVDTDVAAGRSRTLIVYLRDGRRLTFSGMLEDFASLAATLAKRTVPVAPTAQKLEDQRKRTSTLRRLNWVVAMGVVLLPALRLMTDLHRSDGHLSGVPTTLKSWFCAVPAVAQRMDCSDPVRADLNGRGSPPRHCSRRSASTCPQPMRSRPSSRASTSRSSRSARAATRMALRPIPRMKVPCRSSTTSSAPPIPMLAPRSTSGFMTGRRMSRTLLGAFMKCTWGTGSAGKNSSGTHLPRTCAGWRRVSGGREPISREPWDSIQSLPRRIPHSS